MIKVIAAITSDRGLGHNGQLLYHISADLKRFKNLTMGHPIVMGRNTFESFPKGALPGRRNIVITSNPEYSAPGIETFPSLREALEAANSNHPTSEVYVIGGGRVYNEVMPLAHELCLTLIDAQSPDDTDTYFPEIDPSIWQLTDITDSDTDPATGVSYCFATYKRYDNY